MCVLFFPEAEELQEACGDGSCEHSHARLTTGGLLALLVLLLPIALAARISPDSFGRTLIENRGAAETADNVPGMISDAETARPVPTPVYVGAPDSALAAAVPASQRSNPFQYSASVSVPETPDYPSSASMKRGLVPLNERPGAATAFGTIDDILDMSGSPLNQDGGLPESKSEGVVSVDVVDLLIAARKPSAMKALDGRTVEIVGQCLRGGKGSFRLLRLLMICCAADAQPLAVRVEGKAPAPDMAWARVIGRVSFGARGGKVVPLVAAEKVTRVQQPEEPYIY